MCFYRLFYDAYLAHVPAVFVYGSTSRYIIAGDESAVVDEQTPHDLAVERVKNEEYMKGRGAVVLALSGIYGYSRNPLAWLRAGRITRYIKK